MENAFEHNHFMQEIGYEPKGENGITGQRFFQKGGDNRTHHVHIFQVGSNEIERHLAFRDYLREHPKAVQETTKQLSTPYDYANGYISLTRLQLAHFYDRFS
ncbi:GrpB family protein [Paenibacillus peoriae]|uniref:GrpB family protein n=1 Tax=Paenibacillus peoriae TaxID=59893 RepID=UPI00398B49E7